MTRFDLSWRELCSAIGLEVDRIEPITRGYTPAQRAVVTLASGERAFLKVAADEETAEWLKREIAMYDALTGARFMPRCLEAWREGERNTEVAPPYLMLEDLSAAYWPAPWREGDLEAVLETLREVAATPAPGHLQRFEASSTHEGWEQVALAPRRFIELGLRDAAWLERALPTLLEAEASMPDGGGELMHLDVRSDNLCITPDRGALLIDWNWASVGHADYDLAFWLPSLHGEGGPLPDAILPGRPDLAAAVSGFFCSQASLPPLPKAPRVRAIQLAQARSALPWAERALGL